MRKKQSSEREGAFHPGELTDVTILYGNSRAVIRGCRKILSYAPNEIRIALSKQCVCVLGKGLRCVNFAAGSTTVEGLIRSVALESGCPKERDL